MKNKTKSFAFLNLFIAASSHSIAEEPRSIKSHLEEVVVTASKRPEMLQAIPMSVAVVSGDNLKNSNINSLEDIQRAVPSVSFADNSSSDNTSMSIRGIGARITGAGASAIEPSVATVVDGVVLGRSAMSLSNFSDVERIEVLRGPQGTLFGMNASAGVVNILTKDPSDEFNGDLGVSYGSYRESKINGAVSGPLIDNILLGRLSFFTQKRDGYVHNIFDGRYFNDDDQAGYRGKLAILPRDTTKILLNVDFGDRVRQCCVAVIIDSTHNDPVSRHYQDSTSGRNSEAYNGTGILKTSDKNKGVSLQWDEDLGYAQLTSISAYRSWKNSSTNQVSIPSPFPPTPLAISSNDQYQLSQELRLASPVGETIEYVGGVFIFKQRLKTSQRQVFDLSSNGLPFALDSHRNNKIDTLNYAGFGEATFHLTNSVSLIGGARWTHTKLDMDLVGLPPDPLALPSHPAIPVAGTLYNVGRTEDSVTASNWSGRGGVRWKITPENMIYGAISRGFKGPAFNAATGNGASQRVDPERSTNYEFGWKSQFLDRRLRTNVSLFYTDFRDFQAVGFINAGTIQIQQVLLNASKMQSKGAELELEAIPIEGLSLNFNASYVNAIYKDFQNAPCPTGQSCPNNLQDLSGRSLPGQPKWSFNGGSQYIISLPNKPFDGFVRANISWRGRVIWDPNGSRLTEEGAYSLIGGAFGIEDKENKYKFTVFGNNLTNERNGPIAVGATFGYLVTQFLSPDYQRTYGASIDYHF